MKRFRFSFLAIMVVTGFMGSSFLTPPVRLGEGKIKTIVIDAGHGGKDPGALRTTEKEKDITLAIATELKAILKKNAPEIEVILTRDDDTFVELHNRAKHVSDHDADFFVSIHCNSNVKKEAHGAETYVLGLHKENANLDMIMAENSVILQEENHEEVYDGFDPTSTSAFIFFQFLQNVYMEQSILMADMVQKQFEERVGRKNRGVKQAGFLVLWRASKPSILIETGFISNKNEEKFLKSETGQQYMASGIYRAIRDYNLQLEQ